MLVVRLYGRRRGEVIGVRAGAPRTLGELQTTVWDQRDDVLEIQRLTRTKKTSGTARRGRRPVSDETIAQAATIASNALARGKPPAWLIQTEMKVAPSTAKKYLALAREAGLAPPARRGRTTLKEKSDDG